MDEYKKLSLTDGFKEAIFLRHDGSRVTAVEAVTVMAMAGITEIPKKLTAEMECVLQLKEYTAYHETFESLQLNRKEIVMAFVCALLPNDELFKRKFQATCAMMAATGGGPGYLLKLCNANGLTTFAEYANILLAIKNKNAYNPPVWGAGILAFGVKPENIPIRCVTRYGEYIHLAMYSAADQLKKVQLGRGAKITNPIWPGMPLLGEFWLWEEDLSADWMLSYYRFMDAPYQRWSKDNNAMVSRKKGEDDCDICGKRHIFGDAGTRASCPDHKYAKSAQSVDDIVLNGARTWAEWDKVSKNLNLDDQVAAISSFGIPVVKPVTYDERKAFYRLAASVMTVAAEVANAMEGIATMDPSKPWTPFRVISLLKNWAVVFKIHLKLNDTFIIACCNQVSGKTPKSTDAIKTFLDLAQKNKNQLKHGTLVVN